MTVTDAHIVYRRAAEGWATEVHGLVSGFYRRPGRVLGLPYETIMRNPDGEWIVISRHVDRDAAVEDADAAIFAIAAVLDPEHNGPWQEDER